MARPIKKAALVVGVAAAVLVAAIVILLAIVHTPRPEGREGPRADALAAAMENAVNVEAWARTKAVRWTFAGRREHLWDRDRHLARVTWQDTQVLLRLDDRSGRVSVDGREVEGDASLQALERAYAAWVNDSFWLNPIAMFRGEGISRATVELDEGGEGLLVAFSSGGLTPGDAYLWLPGDEGLPRAWRMWVSVIPVGGIETSWTGWQTLGTGARVSTRHVGPLGIRIELTDVEGAETLRDLVGGEDPFAPIVGTASSWALMSLLTLAGPNRPQPRRGPRR